MKAAPVKFVRLASVLAAIICAAVLFTATMTGHDKYRERLIQQPVRPTAGSVQVAVNTPQEMLEPALLLEIQINSAIKQGQAAVVWNGRKIASIKAYGHHFVKVSRELFRRDENRMSLRGLAADSTVTTLEIKNLYGFSTGLLKGVIVPSASPALQRWPWPLALLLALLFLLHSLLAPHAMSLSSRNRWLRYGAWIVIFIFLALVALPLFVPVRIFLGWSTMLLLFAVLLFPRLRQVFCLVSGALKSRVWPWIKTKARPMQLKPWQWRTLAGLALAAIFIFYAAYRQRYVGAADWYGYYAESLLFRQGQLTMKTAFPPEQYPSFAPLGFYTVGNKIIPQYPPGYPLLLALFGFFGLEFFVNSFCGVLTILFLYLILKDIVSRGAALFVAALWALSPMTLWGSMYLMSDLVATLFILMTYYFFRRNKIFWSGVAFSFTIAIRPSNVLFFIVFLPLLFKKKKFWPFCFSAAIIGSLYGLYNWTVFGKPWITGYGNFSNDLIHDVFFQHFIFYGKIIFITMTPLLLIPALLTIVRRKPNSWFYFLWLAAYWVFYSFWKSGGDDWSYLRFLLPGLPALFILAAIGLQDIRERLLTWKRNWRPLWNASAVLLLLFMLHYFISYAKQNYVFSADAWKMYFQASKKIQSLVPPDALVGGLEMSGPIRLYAGLESFRWDYRESLNLIHDFLKKGRPIYVLIEPWHAQHPAIMNIKATFNLKEISVMPESREMILSRVSLRQE